MGSARHNGANGFIEGAVSIGDAGNRGGNEETEFDGGGDGGLGHNVLKLGTATNRVTGGCPALAQVMELSSRYTDEDARGRVLAIIHPTLMGRQGQLV